MVPLVTSTVYPLDFDSIPGFSVQVHSVIGSMEMAPRDNKWLLPCPFSRIATWDPGIEICIAGVS